MLTTKQKRFIPIFLKNGSIDKACKKIKISRATYYNWLQLSDFKNELEQQKQTIYNESLDKLRLLANKSITVLSGLLHSDNENIRLKSSCYLIDKIIQQAEVDSLLDKIEELESRVTNYAKN